MKYVSLLAMCVLFVTKTVSAEVVNIPGTSVTMEPPSGFVMAQQFSGLIHQDDYSSIMITELPSEAYSEIAALFNNLEDAKKSFAANGVNVTGLVNINTVSGQIPVLLGKQTQEGIVFTKYIGLYKGEKTILLNVNINDTDQFSEEIIINSLKSVSLAKLPSLGERVRQLTFIFNESAPFTVLDVISGNTVLLTTTKETDPSGLLPVIIIGTSLVQSPTDDPEKLSIMLVQQLRDLPNAKINIQEQTKFSGGAGYLIQAESNDRSFVHYVSIMPDGYFIRFIARGETEMLNKVMEPIQDVANSVMPKVE